MSTDRQITAKVQLEFCVDPEYLAAATEVPDPVRIVFTDPAKIFAVGVLGESGRRMVLDGAPFYFRRELAETYVGWGIAKLAPKDDPAAWMPIYTAPVDDTTVEVRWLHSDGTVAWQHPAKRLADTYYGYNCYIPMDEEYPQFGGRYHKWLTPHEWRHLQV